MGERVSIRFVSKEWGKGVVLFNHWEGMDFVEKAKTYARTLKDAVKEKFIDEAGPLGRMEPEIAMVDFIRHITHEQLIVDSGLYLGKDEFDGDNDGNGHWDISLDTGEAIKVEKEAE